MKVLVTGGAGFIGSNIVDMLISYRMDTYIVDNLSTGKKENINPKSIFYHADITDKESMAEIFAKVKPDVCIHHAAQIDVQKSLQQTRFDAEVNIVGTINVLDACIVSGVKKIIYASSAAVYGEPNYLPLDEKHAVNPISCYGVSKYVPEHYIGLYSRTYGLHYTILRYSNVYGIRQDGKGEGGVIAIFLDKILKGETPIIYGSGKQTRDFIFVKDVAMANILALTKGDGEIFNISTNTYINLSELVKTIEQVANKKVKPKYMESRQGDILCSYMNNEKARNLLGFIMKYNLISGLTETFEFLKESNSMNTSN
jgi:UDP-glucose 4-epimerase